MSKIKNIKKTIKINSILKKEEEKLNV